MKATRRKLEPFFRLLFVCSLALAVSTLWMFPAVAVEEEPFENPPYFRASDILPKNLLTGPNWELKEMVFNDGYNNIYDAPRIILQSIPGVELVEMKRHGSDSMCCGAGGGLMWLEEREGKRINVARTEQALAVNPTIISTACPYCMTMISDGTKAKEVEDQVQTLDVVEILAKAI